MSRKIAVTILFVLLAVLLFSNRSHAATSPALTPELLWNGQPIDPYCFEQLVDVDYKHKPSQIDIAGCSKHPNIIVSPSDLTLKRDGDGNYGYSYTDLPASKNADGDIYYPAAASYRYIGLAHGSFIVLVEWQGDGTGRFTAGLGITRDGNVLHVAQRYAEGGDRCDGGIGDISIKNGKVVVNYNVTAASVPFILSTHIDPDQFKKNDLQSCAICCVGEVQETDNKVTTFTPEDIQYKVSDASSEHEACFENLMNGIPSLKPWTVAQIKEFQAHFQRKCIDKTGP